MNTAKLWIGCIMAAVLYWGCSKNNSSSTPTLTFKSVNSTNVPYDTTGSLLTFSFTLTENEYNANDTLYVIVQRFPDQTPLPACQPTIDTLAFNMVSLAQGVPSKTGSNFSATLDVSFTNGTYYLTQGYPDIEDDNPCIISSISIPDTAKFSFVIGTVGHYSDTARSGPIILQHAP